MKNITIKCIMLIFLIIAIFALLSYHSILTIEPIYYELKNSYKETREDISLNTKRGIYTVRIEVKHNLSHINLTVTAYLLGVKLSSITGIMVFSHPPEECIFV